MKLCGNRRLEITSLHVLEGGVDVRSLRCWFEDLSTEEMKHLNASDEFLDAGIPLTLSIFYHYQCIRDEVVSVRIDMNTTNERQVISLPMKHTHTHTDPVITRSVMR